MAKFLCQVGRTVDTFLRVRLPTPVIKTPCNKPYFLGLRIRLWVCRRQGQLWRIGPGGIQRSDIVIIGAVHVSAGSWMPIMQLNRYIF
jgi:hypothetical protein